MNIVINDFIDRFTTLVIKMDYSSLEELTKYSWTQFQTRVDDILNS